jgi:hypothetical protein
MAATQIPRDGLVAEWQFNEGSGSVAHDTSGNGNVGSIQGATWVTGISGSALSFNGADNYVFIPNSNSVNTIYTTNQFTISAWINQRSHPRSDWTKSQWIFMKGEWDRDPGYFALLYDAQHDVPMFGVGAKFNSNDSLHGNGSWADASQFSLNQWVHVAGTYDGSRLQIYVDGYTGGASGIIGEQFQPNDGPMMIGHFVNPNWPYPFDGAIDEVRVYNRALNASEIAALAQISSIPPASSNPPVVQFTQTLPTIPVRSTQIPPRVSMFDLYWLLPYYLAISNLLVLPITIGTLILVYLVWYRGKKQG